MSSKNSLFLLKSILLIQILLSISAIYYAYPGFASTYDQGNTAIWITILVFLYWIILGPLFVRGLKHPELHQRMLLFLGGITVGFMLGLLVLLFAWIDGDKQTGELITYIMQLMLSGLLATFFIAMQLSGGWEKLISTDASSSRKRRLG